MAIANFKTEAAAQAFMSELMDHNNQGVQQVLYGWADKNNVEYNFNHIIHDEIYSMVSEYLSKHENT